MRRRFTTTFPAKLGWPVVVAWIFLAVAAILLSGQAWKAVAGSQFDLLPSHSTAEGTDGTSTAYVTVEGSRPLGTADRAYYGAIVEALRNDAHVRSVTDLWSDPLTARLAESKDGKAGYVKVQLAGSLGTRQVQDSVTALRKTVERVPAPADVRATVTGPAVTMDAPLSIRIGSALVVCGLILAAVAAWTYLRARSARAVLLVLFAGTIAFLVAVPLLHWAATTGLPDITTMSATALFAFAFGTVATCAYLVRRQLDGVDREDESAATAAYRRAVKPISALAWPMAIAAGTTAFAPLPAVRALGAAAATGTLVATLVALTMLPALFTLNECRPATTQSASADGPPQRRLPAAIPAVVSIVALLCALPLIRAQFNDELHRVTKADPHFPPAQFLPHDVVVESTHDLRSPGGLIAIDRVTRRLMEIPGVRMVQSASWPAGIPWAEATFAHQAGVLGNQLQEQTTAVLPQVTAIKTMSATVDRLSLVVGDMERAMTTATGGLKSMQNAVGSINNGTKEIQDTVASMSAELDPVRRWMDGVPNCPADVLCSALQRVIGPVDSVQRGITTLSGSASQIEAGSRVTIEAFATTPAAMAQMKTALATAKSVLSGLRTSIEDLIPQVVQMSAYLRNISTDFDDTGEGIFYLSQKTIDSPSYQNAKRLLFSPDGRVTRFVIYGDAPSVGSTPRGLAAEISQIVETGTKYGALTDATVRVTGVGAIATSLQDGAARTIAMVIAALALATLLAAALTRRIPDSLLGGFAAALACAAALGLNLAFWQHFLGDSANRTATLSAIALAAPLALARNVITGIERPAGSFLTVAGIALGAGLILIADNAHKDIGQAGMVLVTALCFNSVLASVGCRFRHSQPSTTNL